MKNLKFKIPFVLLSIFVLFLAGSSQSNAWATQLYGFEISDSIVSVKADSIMQARWHSTPFLGPNVVVSNQIEQHYTFNDKTASFYLALALLMILGILRFVFPTYFKYLYNSFMSPMSNKRALREQIEQNVMANLAMNIFFCISLGLFLFVVLRQRTNIIQSNTLPQNVVLLGFILMTGLIYFIKFSILKFIGWVFNMKSATDDYLYNVFLINKILGVILLPFTIILAFGSGSWLNLIFIIGLFIIFILLLNRYTRSWVSLGAFFQYSKFHFFMYFCASELLPLAILTKFTYNLFM